MNDEYTKQLEKQNEELKELLAKATIWEPVWVKLPILDLDGEQTWELTNGFYIHASITTKLSTVPSMYNIFIMNHKTSDMVEFTLENAMARAYHALLEMRQKRDKNMMKLTPC